VVEIVYHQQKNRPATSSDNRFTRSLANDQQPFYRIGIEVGKDWQPLIENCWITDIGMIHIFNEGTRFVVQPTTEEQAEADAKILEISEKRANGWLIPPKETFRGSPTNPENLWIRSLHGRITYTLTVYPK